MYAVCVTFDLKPAQSGTFLPLMHANARRSLDIEAGCLQFDVLTDPDKPDAVFLYELYTDRAAFDLHLASAHFQTFDAAVADMIAQKHIQTWAQVTQ